MEVLGKLSVRSRGSRVLQTIRRVSCHASSNMYMTFAHPSDGDPMG